MFRTSQFDKLLEKATTTKRLDPDWPSILQICDLIRQSDIQPKAVLAALKLKLTNSNPHVTLSALLVLDSCVKNCGSLIHDEIGTKQYMEQLSTILKTSTNDVVKQRILELIQEWAFAFRNIPKYTAVRDTLNILKAEGHMFPALKESDVMFIAQSAPEWIDGANCHRCRFTFTVMSRKHHCRACGQIFCDQCSRKKSTLPKFGIEKEVRVCDTCYEQLNKPTTVQTKDTDLPAEYVKSSLAQQQQVPPRRTAEEIREEEDLQLALALSQSEAEQKEKEKKRATSALKSNPTLMTRTYSPPPSPGPSPSRIQDDDEIEPELAKYLDRKFWEQRQTFIDDHASRVDVTSPSAPNISSPMPQKIVIAKQQNGEVDNQMEEFVSALRSQVEIFVNRMKSNSSRGRSIANDSSVQTLFMTITAMHSRLLRYIQEQDDNRVYYEGLQDKLTQIKDARAALDALRDEHREKLRRLAEEAERQRQMLMAQKLAIMRKKKQEYLQYQRQLALQKIQEQEREMQMRQEQQKQQYIMGGYQAAVSGYLGQSQGSPVRHIPYQGPGPNYNPMSPTSQGVYMYAQPSMSQYPMPNYNMASINSLPPHLMGPMSNQEQDPSIQGRENIGRVSISGPGMMTQLPTTVAQLPQSSGHQLGPPFQGAPSAHMPPPQGAPSHIVPQQRPVVQLTQPSPSGQVNVLQQVQQGPVGPQSTCAIPHGPGQVVNVPSQMGTQHSASLPGSQGSALQQHISISTTQSQTPSTIQVPTGQVTGTIPAPNQMLQGSQGPGIQTTPAITQISVPQAQAIKFQPAPVITATNESGQSKEEAKPETAELISFD